MVILLRRTSGAVIRPWVIVLAHLTALVITALRNTKHTSTPEASSLLDLLRAERPTARRVSLGRHP